MTNYSQTQPHISTSDIRLIPGVWNTQLRLDPSSGHVTLGCGQDAAMVLYAPVPVLDYVFFYIYISSH